MTSSEQPSRYITRDALEAAQAAGVVFFGVDVANQESNSATYELKFGDRCSTVDRFEGFIEPARHAKVPSSKPPRNRFKRRKRR